MICSMSDCMPVLQPLQADHMDQQWARAWPSRLAPLRAPQALSTPAAHLALATATVTVAPPLLVEAPPVEVHHPQVMVHLLAW